MVKKTKLALVFLVVVLIAGIIVVAELIKPVTLGEELEFWSIVPKNDTEYISDNIEIGNNTLFVYSVLNDGTAENDKDQYIIAVGNIKGLKNNKYSIAEYWEQEDKLLTSSSYLNIYDYPEIEVKNGKDYIGSLYVGTVPITCTSVTIQGESATMVEQSFDLNGEKADFYLYYCVVKEAEYTDSADVKVTDENGKQYSVSTVDGGEYPILTEIK